jgi:hypothetical protein
MPAGLSPLPAATGPPDERLGAAQRLADIVLRPQAERTDREGVSPEALTAIADAGLLAVAVDGPRALARQTAELLSGACLSTWFVAAQHLTPLRMVAALPAHSPVRERWLPGLMTGRPLSGVAFSHLRARSRRPVTARDAPGGGVVLDGTAPWFSGWGLGDVAMAAGLTDGDEVVFGFTSARETPGLRPGPVQDLAAMAGTRTVALHLSGLAIGPEDVVMRAPWEDWAVGDRTETANASPLAFGLAAEILADLRAGGEADGADRLAEPLADLRRRAYALADEAAPGQALPQRLELRAAALDLLVRAAAALVVASGGRGMSRERRPQRMAREALFLTVQAQTPPLRHALLDLLTRPGR